MTDIRIENHGSVILFSPETLAAKNWVEENLGLKGWQRFGEKFAIEGRFVSNIVMNMQKDGLEVSG